MDDFSKMSDAELQALYDQQKAQASIQEAEAGKLPQPISSNDQENVQAILQSQPPSTPSGLGLSDERMSPEFIRDFRAQTGVHPETLVLDAKTRDERFAQSPREALTAAVANGLINPSFQTFDPSIYQDFDLKWNQYKADMESSILGATYRGAKSSAFPTAAATVGSAIGSAAGLVGAIPLGMAAGMGAGMLQEEFFPPTSEDKANLAFDQAQAATRNARLAGELIPSLATLRPTANSTLFKLNPRAVRDFIAGTILSAGLPAAIDYFQGNKFDAERFGWGVGAAAFLTPNKYGKMLFDKFARTEMLATKARNRIMNDERYSGINEGNRAAALSRLEDWSEANVNNIRPMMGEYLDLPDGEGRLVQNQSLISFQKALQHSAEGAKMRQREFDNQVAAAAANERITGLEAVPDEQAARTFFEYESTRLNALAEQTKAQLIAAGDADAALIIERAQAQANALNEARAQGIIEAEQAVASANSVYTQAIEEIHAARGTSTTASVRAVSLLKTLKTAAYAPVKAAYRAISKDARTDYQNTYKAAKRAASKTSLGSLKEAPPLIKDILAQYAPRVVRGKIVLPKVRISVMLKDLETVTEEINKAVLAKENVTARLLGQVKKGIEKDLAVASETWGGIQVAKQMYYEYAQKFVNGKLGDMLHSSQSLDTDLRLSEMLYSTSSDNTAFNGPQQLAMALNGAGDDLILQQLLNDMAQRGGKTSESLKNWMTSDEVSRVLDVFPLRDRLNTVINQVRAAEIASQVERAELAARKGSPEAKADAAELERAKKLQASTKQSAELQYRNEQARLAGEAFTAFVGTDSRNAIQIVMESSDPVGIANQMMQMASADPSGQAVTGIRNAMRQFYKEAVNSSKALVSGINITDPLQLDQLQITSGKINEALTQGSPLRSVMDVVLPPEEMQALDVLRRQIQYITSSFRTVGGGSVTTPLAAAKKELDQALNENLIGVLGKLARGGDLTGKTNTKTTRFLDTMQMLYYGQPDDQVATTKIGKAFKKFGEEWFGLTGKRMQQRALELLVDAQLNPSTVGIECLTNAPASVRGRSFVRAYVMQKDQLVEQPTVLPFNNLDTKQIDLQNGKLLQDGTTGYSIQNAKGNFKVFNEKGLSIGIFGNLEDARQHAVNEYNKYITKKKAGK